ncbi:MAG: hypothetical protein WBP03_00990 [Candidatus Saccharimonadales bacterium]
MRSKKTVVLLAFLIVFLSGMLAVAFFSAKSRIIGRAVRVLFGRIPMLLRVSMPKTP